MQPCKCGSFAINETSHGREEGKHPELCDVCYWREEYELLRNWQPIDTAPQKERLLLWSGTGMYCGHWAKSIETDDEAWIIAEFGNEGDQLLVKATHWMTLPAPPV